MLKKQSTVQAAGAVLAGGAAYASTVLARGAPPNDLFWVANITLLLVLLQQRVRQSERLIFIFAVAEVAGMVLAHSSLAITACTLTPALGGTVFLYALLSPSFDRARNRLALRSPSALAIIVCAWAASAILHVTLLRAAGLKPGIDIGLSWFLANLLATLIAVPLYIELRRGAVTEIFSRARRTATILLLLLVAAITVAQLAQTHLPIVLLLFPALTLTTYHRGTTAGILAVCLIAAITLPLAWHGGSILSVLWISRDEYINFLMVLLLVLLTGTYPLGRALQRNAQVEGLYRLLAYHSRDMITRVDLEGVRVYVSPSVREVLGWEPAEVIGVDAQDLMHPDDREAYQKLLERMKAGEKPTTFLYRGLKKGGGCVWLEATISMVNDRRGRVREYVASSRDVNARIEAEERMREMNAELARLATLDGLTHIPNRRRFDETLDMEWRRGQREGTQLSLLMLDVDHFKAYNDSFGHPCGDDCLRVVADAISRNVQRAADIVARYGGEEFVVLLPGTTVEGATAIASRIHEAVNALQLPHPQSPIGSVSCSIGIASCEPLEGGSPQDLVRAADEALYAAKKAGRNRVLSEVAQA